jgi:hypothetical protein
MMDSAVISALTSIILSVNAAPPVRLLFKITARSLTIYRGK